VRGVGGDAHLGRELEQRGLRRPHPLAADFDHLAARELVVQDSAADAVARLEDERLASERLELEGRRQAREPCTDDRDFGGSRAAFRGRGHRAEP
jgi:hypothetical protein